MLVLTLLRLFNFCYDGRMSEVTMEKIVALAKRRGFIFPGSEIYGGVANTYDYGPMGVELLRNIRQVWWEYFVHQRADMVGLEASIISHRKVWEASGHVAGFADAMIDCKNCQHRMRADHLIEDYLESAESRALSGDSIKEPLTQGIVAKALETKKVEGLSEGQMNALVELFNIPCPKCGDHKWTEVRKFNQLFPINLGIVAGDDSLAYLRGETAQGMFTDFKNIVDSTRVRLPFGVAQNGKSFRNEITPGNSIFRTLVFEQNEIEYFFDEKKSNWEELFEEWKKYIQAFITDVLKIREENIRWREHTDEERSFYSKRTEDVEYNFPFGFKELWGLAYRTNYDLTQHQKYSGQDLTINDPYTQEKILPHVIEPAVGTDRLLLMVLCDAYAEIDSRIVLKIAPSLAPTKVAVFPLVANKEEITGKAKEVYESLRKQFVTVLDDRGNIGKRYLYQDEVGTPWCVTVDYQTLEDGTVTVRDRDTAVQERISIDSLTSYIHTKLDGSY